MKSHSMSHAAPEDEAAWEPLARQWRIRPDTVYLNHGSFGPPPLPVQAARESWQRMLDEQPMDFFLRRMEPAWLAARERLAAFLGTTARNLVFVENATMGMNIVADSFPLGPGDEVLLNNHEYGAVRRIWERACVRAGAEPPRIAQLPRPLESPRQVVDGLAASVRESTRLIVVSHVTSPTALILPVAEIVRLARRHGIAVCIDGPHAPLQTDVNLDELGCDFYTASCHKWLCAPFGSGLLFAAPEYQPLLQPALLSWGRGPSEEQRDWSDEFLWTGTRDPSAYLAVPAAIEFFEKLGVKNFQARSRYLARYARERLESLTGRRAIAPDGDGWYGSMAHVPLGKVDARPLQRALWSGHGVEVPIVSWEGESFVRVSCHLYNSINHIDRLISALRAEGVGG